MGILKQFAIILGFAFLGEIMTRFVPVKLPASVWGIALLFTALRLNILEPKTIKQSTDFLLANMALFFLPTSVAIIEQFELLRPALVRFFAVCVLSTAVTFLAAYASAYITRRCIQKMSIQKKNI